jgi:hypothetical protein
MIFELIGLLMPLTFAAEYKVSIVNDIHLDLNYQPLPLNEYCHSNERSITNISILPGMFSLGTYGCDAPLKLVEVIADEVIVQNHTDIIIMSGDFVAHGISMYPNQPTNTYELLKTTMTTAFNVFSSRFPNSIILPCIGNNDAEYHNMFALQGNANEYYGFLFNLWFTSHPGNSKYSLMSDLQSTFMKGGYY